MPNRDDFDDYMQLVESYLTQTIQWSEVENLSPEYLHLHENDIGHLGRYRMTRYLTGFVRSLGNLSNLLTQIVFCHSYEEESPCPPANCKKDRFFYFKVAKPSAEDISALSFVGPMGEGAGTRPEPLPLSQLPDVLADCQAVQPYLLRYRDTGFECETRVCPATPSEIRRLTEWFREPGGYQFTMYGYCFANGSLPSRTVQLLMRHAFVTHIVSWNHALLGAHHLRTHLVKRLEDLKVAERWDEGQKAVTALLESVGQIGRSSVIEQTEMVVPVDRAIVSDPGHPNSLFRKNEFHDINDITDMGRFQEWYRRIKLLGGPDLVELLEYCGVLGCISNDGKLSQEEQLVWARSIWCAAKLLTRRMEGDQGIWADQVMLSLLLGLSKVERSQIPIHICYRLMPSAETEQRAASLVPEFLAYCSISNKSDPNGPFHPCGWHIVDGESGPEARWSAPDTGTLRDVLKAFVKAGLLRVKEKPERSSTATAANLLRVRGGPHETDLQQRCLANLRDLAEELARTMYTRTAAQICLRALDVVFEVQPSYGIRGRSRLTVEFSCEGALRGDLLNNAPGQFTRPVSGIMKCFGQQSLLALSAQSPGLRVGTKDGTTRIVLVFYSRDELWPESM